MYDLIQVGENTYYIQAPVNIGIYHMGEGQVVLIDSGIDKDAGKRILRVLEQNQWSLRAIINTHSHADHIGGNPFLQEKTGCEILATRLESAFIEFPHLEPSFLYGAAPFQELRNKFLQAKPSKVTGYLEEVNLPGIEIFPLPGHSYDMVGVKTADQVLFLADCVFSQQVVEKYPVSFLYDVKAFLETLDQISDLSGTCFIPSHCVPMDSIKELSAINKKKVEEVSHSILVLCQNPISESNLIQQMFKRYHLEINLNQHVLIGSTIKAHLSYLKNQDKITYYFHENDIMWNNV